MSSDTRVPHWLITAGGVAWRFLVIVAAVGVVVWAVSHVLLVFVPLLIALMLATVLVPAATRLERLGLPNALSALVGVLGTIALIAAVIALVVPAFLSQLDELSSSVQEGLQTALDLAASVGVSADQAREWLDRAAEQLQQQAGAIGGGLLAGAVAVVEFVSGVVLTFVIAFFLVKDREQITGWFVARTPSHRRDDLSAAAGRAWNALGGYFRGQAIIAFVDALGIAIGLIVIGVPLVLPLAVLIFIGGFFPIVGAVLAGMVAVLVALVEGGLVDALLVLGVVIAVQQTEGNILQPVVLGRAVPLHPLVVLLALAGGAVVAGVVGAFLAVPIAAVVAAVANELRLRREAAAAA